MLEIIKFLKIILKQGKSIKFLRRDGWGGSSQKKTETGKYSAKAGISDVF